MAVERLPVMAVAAISSPDDVFECPAKCSMRAGICVARQLAKRGNSPVYVPCGIGRRETETSCEVGRAVRARIPDFVPGRYRENRPGSEIKAQHATRDQRARETEPSWEQPDLPGRAPRTRNRRMRPTHPIGSQRTCTGKVWNGKELVPCTRALRANSEGDLCYECRIQSGAADKHAARKRRALVRRENEDGLPDPTSLPASYLDRCVREAFARLERAATR